MSKKLIVDPQLNPNLTFATFIEGVRECNRLARSAGMSVAVNPGNNPSILFIYMGIPQVNGVPEPETRRLYERLVEGRLNRVLVER